MQTSITEKLRAIIGSFHASAIHAVEINSQASRTLKKVILQKLSNHPCTSRKINFKKLRDVCKTPPRTLSRSFYSFPTLYTHTHSIQTLSRKKFRAYAEKNLICLGTAKWIAITIIKPRARNQKILEGEKEQNKASESENAHRNFTRNGSLLRHAGWYLLYSA